MMLSGLRQEQRQPMAKKVVVQVFRSAIKQT